MTEKCIETNFNPAELLQTAFLKKIYRTIEKINVRENLKNLSQFEKEILNDILHMFLIKLFSIDEKYINKSERKIIDKLIIDINFDIERVDELEKQALYFLNRLVSKNILIKTKRKNIFYYRLNKEYIKNIEEEIKNGSGYN